MPWADQDRAANAVADTSPTMPAGHRYTGVLHDALGYPTLRAAARRRADSSVVVLSGLWGATRPTDLLPAYRIGINTKLPKIGPLPTFWKPHLSAALDELVATHGAIDLRSSGYSQMYKPSKEASEKLLAIAVTGPDGKKAASSYQSKVAKGRLTRSTLELGTPTLKTLVEAAHNLGLTTETEPGSLTVKLPIGWGLVNQQQDQETP